MSNVTITREPLHPDGVKLVTRSEANCNQFKLTPEMVRSSLAHEPYNPLHWLFIEAIEHPGKTRRYYHIENTFWEYETFARFDPVSNILYTSYAACPRSYNHHVGSTCPICGMGD